MLPQLKVFDGFFIDVASILTPLILLAIWFLLDQLMKRMLKKVFKPAVGRLNSKSSKGSLAFRLKTIRQLVTQLARLVLALMMGFWVLSSVGIDVRPIIAGIGVAGLGLSLAAQNIIRDFLNGFIILIEDQYNVGDWISVNSYSGTVERFTLRSTRIRDIEGNLITIPNSTIQSVVNNTKDWSMAVIKVGITYEDDYSKAKQIIQELAKEVVAEGSTSILEAPIFQGITDFGESAIGMRIMFKTLPGHQWEVGRSYREKLKQRFDSAGVNFAYPQVVVHQAS